MTRDDEQEAFERRIGMYGCLRTVPPPEGTRLYAFAPKRSLWRKLVDALRGAWLGFVLGWEAGSDG